MDGTSERKARVIMSARFGRDPPTHTHTRPPDSTCPTSQNNPPASMCLFSRRRGGISDLTIGQFVYVIRKRIELPPEKACQKGSGAGEAG